MTNVVDAVMVISMRLPMGCADCAFRKPGLMAHNCIVTGMPVAPTKGRKDISCPLIPMRVSVTRGMGLLGQYGADGVEA